MNITIEHISKGIIHWAEVDLISKGSLIQQGITTFIVLQTKPRIMNILSSLVLLSDNGVFDIESLEMIEGDLPKRAKKLVQEWADENKEELKCMWETKNFNILRGLE